ncbi:serine hydroxymethyltransferase [Williamsia sterculiae]|uniref:Serine hydroxymethyltransferase n=1 Tax=Williamsia sterculiae TaxID=1344003 RepID=A0A1N7E2I1_9NOCA|nr:serine hydroxymethyltransferase [Williamsia sterculiae]SIR82274.1 glycine hydroxymethyltransferase [Williamsia sterculiae]
MSSRPHVAEQPTGTAFRDPEVDDLVAREADRRRTTLQLIASENPAIPAVDAALGSAFAAKYAEGYPGARYHAGCDVVDDLEDLATRRARDLFGAEHANVQPHSGTSANVAVYAAFAQPGDPVLALRLDHGGHQSHGSRANFSGRWFSPSGYGVRADTELIDYDQLRELALVHRPRMLVAGASSYPRAIDFAVMRSIADEIEAILWVDAAHLCGLFAADVLPSAVGVADVVTGVTHKVLRGPRGGFILSRREHAHAIDKAVYPFVQGGPAMNAIAGKAVAFADAGTDAFAAYVRDAVTTCAALCDELERAGLRVVTGGTDMHLAVIDVGPFGISGRTARDRLGRAGIVCDKAVLPFDRRPAVEGSGVRIGTAGSTAQGVRPDDAVVVAGVITDALRADPATGEGARTLDRLRTRVAEFLSRPRPTDPST